jgi:outer membrane protein assembly factor BamE
MTPTTARSRIRNALIAVAALLALGTLSGCVYRIDIQQGNFLEAKDIDRVAVGMTRVQVRSLLGTPMVADPFEGWRWDYVYYMKKGRWRKPEQRHFIVFFEEDKVTRIDRPDQNVPKKADQTEPATDSQKS